MSIQITDLTKQFGTQLAVDQLSFEAKPGEILGFLGPNGAGKSTTMKMITGYLSPTAGQVQVCGFDPETNKQEVQKRLGYLPEHNPLYLDMYVKEYLQFVGRIHGVKPLAQRIPAMIERTGLAREQHKKIGALSKGYRQRVGLAQAMLHDPEVLILDEPVSGLDPNQRVDIRNLIKEMGQEKTVILSTHIMQEVQAVCDRVIIINQGSIVADDPITRLQDRISGNQVIQLELAESIEAKQWQALTVVESTRQMSERRWELLAESEADIRPEVFNYVVQQGWTLLELRQLARSVEEVFQELTRS
jgi:ABC-2 type transport system ATP-binding protein